MNLSQLEVLVAIVDSGSLTEAAEMVGLTQSAVSYSLSKLEAELGVTLLERGRQGVAVTRIGAEVVHHARVVLSQIESIRQKSARERGLTVGKVRFGCVTTIPPRLLTGILRDFQQKYPDIELVVFEGTPRELLEWLQNGVIDIATVTRPDVALRSVSFVQAEAAAIVPARHPLAANNRVTLEQLADQPFIGPKADYGALQMLLGHTRIAIPRLHHEVSSPATIFAMVRQEMGVAIVLKLLIDSQLEGIALLELDPKIHVEIYLAANTDSPAVDAFMESASLWARTHGFSAESA